MFFMLSKVKKMLWHFLIKSKHLMALKTKDKEVILTKLCFKQFHITRKLKLQGFFVDKGSRSEWPKKTGSDRIRNTAVRYIIICWPKHFKQNIGEMIQPNRVIIKLLLVNLISFANFGLLIGRFLETWLKLYWSSVISFSN